MRSVAGVDDDEHTGDGGEADRDEAQRVSRIKRSLSSRRPQNTVGRLHEVTPIIFSFEAALASSIRSRRVPRWPRAGRYPWAWRARNQAEGRVNRL